MVIQKSNALDVNSVDIGCYQTKATLCVITKFLQKNLNYKFNKSMVRFHCNVEKNSKILKMYLKHIDSQTC